MSAPGILAKYHAAQGAEEKFQALAELSHFDYERLRISMAEEMEIRVSALDKEVDLRRRTGVDSNHLDLNDPEPWPEPVNGVELLDAIERELQNYIVVPDVCRTAASLWVLMTWLADIAYLLPLLVISSPQKRCGKSNLLILLRKMTRRGLMASNISPSAVYRVVEMYHPTLLLDEADAWATENDALRGIINAGHSRDTSAILRASGDQWEPKIYSSFCPKAIAGIGRLAGTLEDRAIIIEMRRRRSDEPVQQLRHALDLSHIRRLAMRWAADNRLQFQAADPSVPPELHDRAADNWRPLLAIAELAGGDWRARAEKAAIKLTLRDGEQEDVSILLLSDIRDLFGRLGPIIRTSLLLEHLNRMDERPWGEWRHGKPVSKVQLANMLRPFGIRPTTIRVGKLTPKGYILESFLDAFSRYLPSNADQSATPQHEGNQRRFDDVSSSGAVGVADRNRNITEEIRSRNGVNPNKINGCCVVAD